MRFSDIIGHDAAKSDLRRMADSGQIPHALLISGQPGIGKMSLARAFAQYIHCMNRHDGDSCGKCAACRQAEAFNDPDLRYSYPVIKKTAGKPAISSDFASQWKQFLHDSPEMDLSRWQLLIGAENKQPMIYVDEADDISYNANISSFAYKEKIFIIWLPERFGTDTANKLLKLIEEPYPDTYFILVSNDAGGVLPTIYSRTRRIELRPLPSATVAGWMTSRKGVDADTARALAPLAEGSLLKALDIALGAGETEEFGELYREMMRTCYLAKIASMAPMAERIADFGREKAIRYLDYTGRMLRENFIFNLQTPALNHMTAGETEFSRRFCRFVNERNVEEMMIQTDRARSDIGRNANAKVVMTDYFLRLARLLRM